MRAKVSRALGFCALMLGLLALPGCAQPDPILILVSLDGFRWDYLDRVETPHLDRLATQGVRAEGLIPVFPSKTFPSHYSIVTGLYPGHHGIVSNNMYDVEMDAEFHLHDRAAVEDPRWWGGEPIWVTAERQGVTSATLFWPGSETAVSDIRPTYWHRFDREMSFAARVARVLNWLSLPETQRPRLITLYFEHPNDIGHRYGPEAPETFASVRAVDGHIGELVRGIEERQLSDRVNLVVVSDHGMAEVGPDRVIVLADHVELEEGELLEDGALLQICPHAGREETIFNALAGASPHLAVYRGSEIPEGYRLRDSPRIAPIVGVPEVGWEVVEDASRVAKRFAELRGDHGQDPGDQRMHGLFLATGPAFRSGVVIDRFENIEIYHMLAAVLHLEPAPNDGDPSALGSILTE